MNQQKNVIKIRTAAQIEAAAAADNFEPHCPKCFRPAKTCYCKYIQPVKTGVKFVFLMHPKEAYKQRTGTGRLAQLTLVDSEIIVGVDFTQNSRVNALINNPDYIPLLLYPGEDAFSAQSFADYAQTSGVLQNAQTSGTKQLLVFVVDSTWFFAKKMLRLSPNVKNLQKLSFTSAYRSQFKFKTQPAAECLSTIESCYYLIKELQAAGLTQPCNPEPLMDIFKRMVDFQLESQAIREQSGEADRYQTSGSLRAKKRALREQQQMESEKKGSKNGCF